jgi:vacuolar protein sorting-associated protein 51
MKARAENLDGEMDLLKAAFSEISRLSAEVTMERNDSHYEKPKPTVSL